MRIMNLTLPYANPLSSAHAHILLLLNGESLNKKPVTVLLRRAILKSIHDIKDFVQNTRNFLMQPRLKKSIVSENVMESRNET